MQRTEQCFILVWTQDSGQVKKWLYMWIKNEKRVKGYNFLSERIITMKRKNEREVIIY